VQRLLPVAAASLFLAAPSASFAETILLPGSDETVPAPEITSIGPHSGPDGSSAEPGPFVVISFLTVPEAVGYRIYHEVYVRGRLDPTGALVPTDTREWQFVPWGSADAVPGASALHVVIASLESAATRYGVAAEVIRDGEVHLSPVAVVVYAGASTALPTTSWGVVKRLRGRLPG